MTGEPCGEEPEMPVTDALERVFCLPMRRACFLAGNYSGRTS